MKGKILKISVVIFILKEWIKIVRLFIYQKKEGGTLAGAGRGGAGCGEGWGGTSPLQVPFVNHEIIFYYFFSW